MKRHKYSVIVSLILTDVFAVLLVVGCCTLPMLAKWYVEYAGRPETLARIIPAACYPCAVPAAVLLIALHRLLSNVLSGRLFVRQNVTMLRVISWCCAVVSVITLADAFFYLPFSVIAIAAAFFTLILQVLKNVFRSAVEIQDENDMTI